MIRFFFLTTSLAYGVLIAVCSQVSSANHKSLAAQISNHFLWYACLVAGYLWVNRMKEWKTLVVASLLVLGFVVELVLRVRAG